MPQLLFLPLQHWREPPCSLWSQQWTGPPFSSWTQAPSANEHSEILSARTSIKPWCFVWSISRVVALARAGRLEENLSSRLIYHKYEKSGDDPSNHAGSFKCFLLFLGSVSKYQDPKYFTVTRIFSGTKRYLCACRAFDSTRKCLTDYNDSKLYIHDFHNGRGARDW